MSKEEITSRIIQEIASDPRTSGLIAGTTVTTSAGHWFDIIPDDIGKIGVLISIGVSLMIGLYQYALFKKVMLENEINKRKEQERRERLDNNEPSRRSSD